MGRWEGVTARVEERPVITHSQMWQPIQIHSLEMDARGKKRSGVRVEGHTGGRPRSRVGFKDVQKEDHALSMAGAKHNVYKPLMFVARLSAGCQSVHQFGLKYLIFYRYLLFLNLSCLINPLKIMLKQYRTQNTITCHISVSKARRI